EEALAIAGAAGIDGQWVQEGFRAAEISLAEAEMALGEAAFSEPEVPPGPQEVPQAAQKPKLVGEPKPNIGAVRVRRMSEREWRERRWAAAKGKVVQLKPQAQAKPEPVDEPEAEPQDETKPKEETKKGAASGLPAVVPKTAPLAGDWGDVLAV